MKHKRWSWLLAAAVLMLTAAFPVRSHAAPPDLEKKGSVSLKMKDPDTGKTVSGGKMTLYFVAAAKEENGNYSFVYRKDFSGCTQPLENLESAELAKELAAYAKQQEVKGRTTDIGEDGRVSFSDLETGLYLMVQTEASSGYYPVAPFLVTIPGKDRGEWVYDVDALPKLELESKPGEPEKPGEPGRETPPEPGKRLPQTGQLNWPVPVLTILGLLFFAAGWGLRFGRKEENHAA